MGKSNERSPCITSIQIGTRASTAAVVLPGVYFRKHSRIKSVHFTDQAGQALSTSNFVTLLLKSNASSPVAYATVTTSAVAAVALTPLALAFSPSSGSDANSPELDVPAGTMLNIDVAFGGTGHCVDAKLQIEWYPV